MKSTRFLILFLIILAPSATALSDFTEDFEDEFVGGFDPELKPDENWYDYSEGSDFGVVTNSVRVIGGSQSFWWDGPAGIDDLSKRSSYFGLEIPSQVTELDFSVNGATIADTGSGSQQKISIQSRDPIRTMVQFFVFCRDTANTTGCDFRVKWDSASSIGDLLVESGSGVQEFDVEMDIDWIDAEFCLMVNAVDDGCFPFLEFPQNFWRVKVDQYRRDVPINLTFDDWTVRDAEDVPEEEVVDIAEGIRNFAVDMGFESSTSQFLFGFILFLVILFAVLMPAFVIGESGDLAPAISFYGILCVLWLISLEIWPEWIALTTIILASALIGTVVRRLALGIKDASTGTAIIAGSLGYFIIASTLLAFSGFATDTITVPQGPAEQSTVNETENPDQSFVGAVAECVFTGGAFTFGLKGDCSQKTVSKTWTQITDVFGWIRTGLDFLFQLLTFQLPIPVVFSVMIVLPPAAAIAVEAFRIIRSG